MADKALYILAGYDERTQARLCGIQQMLRERGFSGRQTKDIPQHVTLGSYSICMEEELVNRLQSIADKTDVIDVTFNHVGLFGGGNVLFIAPDVGKDLLELKEEFGESLGWTPHTTMLIDDPEVVLGALPVVLGGFSSFAGRIETLHLYEFWPTRHILTAALRGAKRRRVPE